MNETKIRELIKNGLEKQISCEFESFKTEKCHELINLIWDIFNEEKEKILNNILDDLISELSVDLQNDKSVDIHIKVEDKRKKKNDKNK